MKRIVLIAVAALLAGPAAAQQASPCQPDEIGTTVCPAGKMNTLGNANTFWVYALLNLFFILLTVMLIPETKNVSLEHIERNLMAGKKLRDIGSRD